MSDDNGPGSSQNSMIPMYVTCRDCGTNSRVERLDPITRPGVLQYCPVCGSSNTLGKIDFRRDYWYVMAETCGLTPSSRTAKLVRELYDLWDPLERPRFVTFVKESIREERTA